MYKVLLVSIAFCLTLGPALAADAQGNSILDKLVNVPSATSWKAQGLSQWPEEIKDPSVTAGVALRFPIKEKGANPWSVAASVPVTKLVKKGDVILFAFWARAEVPLEGTQTGSIPSIRIEEVKAPYTPIAQDSATITTKWAMYYASGVAGKDYTPGSLKATVHLAAGKQTIDLGPVFVLDFGPGYDMAKLPHNKPAVAAVPAAPAAAPAPRAAPTQAVKDAEQRFAGELAQIRAKLPVPGELLNNPAVTNVGIYGPDIQKTFVAAADVPGGQAVRVQVEKMQTGAYLAGTAAAIAGDIRKGDTILVAFYARTAQAEAGAQSGVIAAMRVQMNHAPYESAVEAPVRIPPDKWQLFYISGVSPVDIPAGTGMLSAQMGDRKQTIDFGPAFILDLGPGVNPTSLPSN